MGSANLSDLQAAAPGVDHRSADDLCAGRETPDRCASGTDPFSDTGLLGPGGAAGNRGGGRAAGGAGVHSLVLGDTSTCEWGTPFTIGASMPAHPAEAPRDPDLGQPGTDRQCGGDGICFAPAIRDAVGRTAGNNELAANRGGVRARGGARAALSPAVLRGIF